MPPFHKLEAQVAGSASFREYEASEKNPFLEMMPAGTARVEAPVVRRASEPRVVARTRDRTTERTNDRTTTSESDCPRRKIDSSGSSKSIEPRSWQSSSSSRNSASLRSLVRRRARQRGASSLPREVETAGTSSYSSQTPCYPHEKVNGVRCRSAETCNTASPASTLLYGSAVQASSSKGDNQGYDASSSTSNVVAVSTKNVLPIASTGRFSGNAMSCARTASVAASAVAGPSTSSWANAIGQDSDCVIDPVEGNVYHKGQILGMGGFARVFLITDVSDGKQYACKIIPKKRMHTDHMRKIAREIMIHKPLNHVNVVQMHHYFQDSLNVYMLLEACPRKSLKHVLKLRGKVTEPEARYYMKQMVTGVAYIHSQKVVHRDLKPDNMFLSSGMIVKIGDFGLATRPDGQRRPVTICGTANYIAPEVLYEKAYSYEADVWALGCILYALLVGQPPFDSATRNETYARICSNTYREVDDTMACRNGQDLVKWLLQPNPEHRPTLDKVREHAYLTKEHVPTSLPHTCCYQMPHSAVVQPHSSPPTAVSTTSGRRKSRKAQAWQEVVPQEAKHRHQQVVSTQQIQQDSHHRLQQLATVQPQRSNRSGRNKNSRKLSRAINWLGRLFRHCSYCPDKKLGGLSQSAQIYRALADCISEMKCNNARENPKPVKDAVPLFITKWMDYSNKYGLVFQLSDKSVGVLFNDNTKISYTQDRRVEYMTVDDEVTRYKREKDVPAVLQEKLKLLQRFTQYMDDFITEGGEIKERRVTKQSKNACVPRMRRWLLIEKTMVMELTIPLVQVNFVDHTKMIVAQESPKKGYLLTYIDTNKCTASYWLKDIRDHGCTGELCERLHYLCNATREFAELDNGAVA